MYVDFSTLSHHIHDDLCEIHPFKLGQSQQLLAAAFGYLTLAAYRASSEEHDINVKIDGGISFVNLVIDQALVKKRCLQLDLRKKISLDFIVYTMCASIGNHLDREVFKVYIVEEDLFDEIRSDVEIQISDSEEFSSAMAETNTSGLGEFDIEFSPRTPVEINQHQWNLGVTGTCFLDQDPERPYSGDVLSVTAEVEFLKLGRRFLTAHKVFEIDANVQYEMGEDAFDIDDDGEQIEKPEAEGYTPERVISESEFDRLIDEAEAAAQKEAEREERALFRAEKIKK